MDSIQQIQATDYTIEIGSLVDSSFVSLLTNEYAHSKKIILVDENTHDSCLEYLLTAFDGLEEAEVMLLPEGEQNKVMEVCFQVWEALSEYGVGRRDLIINLGGGVVTDMGGFIASIYKRGVDFIHIPTSLLGMVDASVGGKTGIDMGMYKNQLGVFANPKRVFVDLGFLNTLPSMELANGYAEMIKHGLIADENHWNHIKNINPREDEWHSEWIVESIAIKNKIVLADPREKNDRKKLNFGHTFGHAFEGMSLGWENPIPHGYAVALGMLAEAYISKERKMLSTEAFEEIKATLERNYEMMSFSEEIITPMMELMQNDKKNYDQKIKCVLLTGIGSCEIDQDITEDDALKVIHFFDSLT